MSALSHTPITSVAGAKGAGLTKDDKDAPANAVSVASRKKEPPPEKPESIRLRSFVILSFWAIIILVGLPIWWKTTTIYRASLPLVQMMDWADGRVQQPRPSEMLKTDDCRPAAQFSHFEYQLRQALCKITKHSTFCGRLNTHWTI